MVLILAADKCKKDKWKTINGDDLIFAMEALGFDAYLPGLRIFLQNYKTVHKTAEGEEIKDNVN